MVNQCNVLPDVLPKWSVVGPVLELGVRPCPSVQSRSSVLDWVHPQSPLSKVHTEARKINEWLSF